MDMNLELTRFILREMKENTLVVCGNQSEESTVSKIDL